jgi:hypothetical protein
VTHAHLACSSNTIAFLCVHYDVEMSRFWVIIVCVLVGPFVLAVLPRQRLYATDSGQRLVFHLFTGVLVAVIWAICFRPQLERGRLTTTALFALVAMEAVYLALVRVMNPWGPF